MNKLLSVIVLFLILVGCHLSSSKQLVKKGENVKYATHFDVIKKGEFTYLKIIDPETHQTEIQYFLKKKGQQDQKGFISIEVPIQSIAALSSTHIGMLNKLESLNVVKVISDTNYLYNSLVKKECKAKRIKSIGGEGLESVEGLVRSGVNVVMYSGFGKPFSHQDKLEKLKINCIPNYDWREIHPLGKAEWIKVFGYLLGKEKEANAYLSKIEAEYYELVELAKTSVDKKTMFCGNLVGDNWFTPAGESFNAQLYRDANIAYVYANSKGTGSLSKSFEEILIDNQHTSFWLNPGFVSFTSLITNQPKMNYFEAVKNKQVYDYVHEMNFFWENSAIEPQKVLSDLIKIFHPEMIKDTNLYFYQKLGN